MLHLFFVLFSGGGRAVALEGLPHEILLDRHGKSRDVGKQENQCSHGFDTINAIKLGSSPRREKLYTRQKYSLIGSDLLLMFSDTGSLFSFQMPMVWRY